MPDNSETAAPETPAADANNKRRRAIQMSSFRSKAAIAAAITGNSTVLATVVGMAYASNEKWSTPPGASAPALSYLITGDFQAAVQETGEVFEAGSIYLPNYFAQEIAGMLSKSSNPIGFAVEIGMEPNPKSKEGEGVAYQYYVRSLIPREPTDPLYLLKQKMAAAGTLGKLPPPPGMAVPQLASPTPAPQGDAAPQGETAGKGKAKG